MSETKFTPGPWKNTAPKIAGIVDPLYRTIYAGCGHGADQAGFQITGFISEANANLIAAAPELYYALESLLDRIKTYPQSLYPAIDAANDALAKARGEK